jgi:hypothetical protein
VWVDACRRKANAWVPFGKCLGCTTAFDATAREYHLRHTCIKRSIKGFFSIFFELFVCEIDANID